MADAPGETWSALGAALAYGLRGLTGGDSLARLLARERGVRNVRALPPFTIDRILAQADAHRRATGKWPNLNSGSIAAWPGETWRRVDKALRAGRRGLPGGSSLARLLRDRRGARYRNELSRLTEAQILAWADAFRARRRRWPTRTSGRIPEANDDTWASVDVALRHGRRGLRRGSSLARFLARHRRVRNIAALPDLSVTQILRWAAEHRARTQRWPTMLSGPVVGTPGESWVAINAALRVGRRGLPAGGSLARLLAKERGVSNRASLTPLTIQQILQWADAHRRRTGEWPTAKCGRVFGAPGESWLKIDASLLRGGRGLRTRLSLANLLAKYRGKRNPKHLPPLNKRTILYWADRHHARTGRWPNDRSGPIPGSGGENWCTVNHALTHGTRGLKAYGSLPRFLSAHKRKPARGVFVDDKGDEQKPGVIRHDEAQILAWADCHHERTGKWPTQYSGPIAEVSGISWGSVQRALLQGRCRQGRSSIAILLARERAVPNSHDRPRLTESQILAWADRHKARTGRWPTVKSGPVLDASGENWRALVQALVSGLRGLPGGDTLARLLARERGVRNRADLPPYRLDEILSWGDEHHVRTGHWPRRSSGAIQAAPGETWSAVNSALNKGFRGLPKGSSLTQFLAQHRSGAAANPLSASPESGQSAGPRSGPAPPPSA